MLSAWLTLMDCLDNIVFAYFNTEFNLIAGTNVNSNFLILHIVILIIFLFVYFMKKTVAEFKGSR